MVTKYWIVIVALKELYKNYFNFSMCMNVQYENDNTKASKFAFMRKKRYNSNDTTFAVLNILRHIFYIRCNLSFIIVLIIIIIFLASFFDTFLHVSNTRVYGLAGADNTSSYSFLFSDRSFLIISFCHIFQDLHHSFASIYTFIDSCK